MSNIILRAMELKMYSDQSDFQLHFYADRILEIYEKNRICSICDYIVTDKSRLETTRERTTHSLNNGKLLGTGRCK